MKYNGTNLKEVLEAHKRWLNEDEGWTEDDRADFSYADLTRANLTDANLTYADLTRANLTDANLTYANLTYANLTYANLTRANLTRANLTRANLTDANLTYANLTRADLTYADLTYADLTDADLTDADLIYADLTNANLTDAKNVPFVPTVCPSDGAFIGWKKAANGAIVKLLIPVDAKRSSATTRKCRCDKATVLAIENPDGTPFGAVSVPSNHNRNFIYTVGETVSVPDFDENRWRECAAGIHFFINRQEAVEYRM